MIFGIFHNQGGNGRVKGVGGEKKWEGRGSGRVGVVGGQED